MSLWLIGVVCAREMQSLWTIFFSIVRLLVPYRVRSLVVLGFIGLCLEQLLICMLVGGVVVALRVLLCGR